MNNNNHREYVQKAVEGKFRGSGSIKSKVTPRYPDSAERELVRITESYVKVINEELRKQLPEIMKAYQSELNLDDRQSFFERLTEKLRKAAEAIEKRLAKIDLAALIAKAGKTAKKLSVREWKRIVRQTLGIDLLEDYYNGEMYEQLIQRWIAENVSYIKSIPNQTLDNMKQIISDGYLNGKSVRDIQKAIQDEYGVTKSKAEFLARDQLSTLNAQISQMQQKDAGCTHYKWSSVRDSRVRECHRELDGKIFSWDDPPEMWYRTKSRGKVMTGRRCHPGEDFCCRCVAIPIFDFETLDVPIKPTDKGERGNGRQGKG